MIWYDMLYDMRYDMIYDTIRLTMIKVIENEDADGNEDNVIDHK